MKKYFSLILAMLMVLTALFTMVACNEDPGTGGTGTGTGTGTGGGSSSTDRIPLDYLPTDGYNDATFHILAWTANGVTDVGVRWIPWEEGDVAEKDGDMLGSAVFDRNAWVEENFGVKITQEYWNVDPIGNAVPYTTVVRNNAGSSDSAYQLYTLRSVGIVSLIEEEMFADLNDYSQYLHLDQPWWVQDSVASFTLALTCTLRHPKCFCVTRVLRPLCISIRIWPRTTRLICPTSSSWQKTESGRLRSWSTLVPSYRLLQTATI